ncbi:MAG: hypothetical protein EBV24_09270 [Actinobacteria bacterium]|nr:hypothetical protein [Actinomycetota bacterium]
MDSTDMDHSLPFDADPIQPAPAAAIGRRSESPQFTDDPMLDRLYGITMALITEARSKISCPTTAKQRHAAVCRPSIWTGCCARSTDLSGV